MSDILRVVSLRANPWVETGPDHCGDAIKLAIRADVMPRSLRVDERPQAVTFTAKTRDGARWWTTTVGAPWWVGTVGLSVIIGDRERRWSTEILPAEGIFSDGRDAVDRLLTRLIEGHAHLPWGHTGATRAGDLGNTAPEGPTPPKLHIAALDAWMPRLLTALGRIERQPLRTLAPARSRRPVERTTRVDDRTLVALGRQPALAAALRGAPSPGGHPRLDVPTSRSTVAHVANRALVHGLRGLARQMGEAARAFEAYRESVHGTQGAQAKRDEVDRQLARLAGARDALAATLRRAPWRGLTPAAPGPSAEQVFADDPLYGEAMRTIRRLMRPVVQPRIAGLVEAHLRAIFDLWEQYVWCRVVRVVGDVLGPGWRWTPPRFTRIGLGVGPEENGFAVARRGDVRVRVGSQVVFRAGRRHVADGGDWRDGRFSLHCTRKPDVTVEVEGPDGCRWFVLDAKFTAGRHPVETDHLPVTHHYRDGLRLGGRRPDGVFLVLPALDEGARCYAEASYHDAFAVGVLVDGGLTRQVGADTPEDDYRPLVRWLGEVLAGGLPGGVPSGDVPSSGVPSGEVPSGGG